MDVNHIRIGAMLLGFAAFLWLVFWAWSRKRRASFDDAARLPFVDSELPHAAPAKGETR